MPPKSWLRRCDHQRKFDCTKLTQNVRLHCMLRVWLRFTEIIASNFVVIQKEVRSIFESKTTLKALYVSILYSFNERNRICDEKKTTKSSDRFVCYFDIWGDTVLSYATHMTWPTKCCSRSHLVIVIVFLSIDIAWMVECWVEIFKLVPFAFADQDWS